VLQKLGLNSWNATRIWYLFDFAEFNFDDGYIDDFGCWRSYEWTDYFERIFNTRSKDVRMKMYMAMQVAK